jgi:alcohol dehydrogenase class IV
MTAPFRHREADRTLLFGRGVVAQAPELLGDGFTLLTTPRAATAAPDVVARAGRVVEVAAGKVDEVAGELLAGGVLGGETGAANASAGGSSGGVSAGDNGLLVALGGGRVVDVAKALAAGSSPQRRVAAIPTTVSGAEMTRFHRHARGVEPGTPFVQPSLVINDPALSASHDLPQLAASSGNALGHALVALTSVGATPFSAAVAADAVQRFARAWGGVANASRGARAHGAPGDGTPGGGPGDEARTLTDADRDEIALGALLAGWAVDHSGLGLHHVLAQTAVRTLGVGHAEANVALLPESIAAIRRRRPEPIVTLDAQLTLSLEQLARVLRIQAGGEGLSVLARDEELLERAVAAAAARTAELARIPPPPTADEIRTLYRAAAAAAA